MNSGLILSGAQMMEELGQTLNLYPYQFYGSDLFTFALRHLLCGQKYYAGLSGSKSYMKIGVVEGIREALEEYRITGVNRYEVPDRVVGKPEKLPEGIALYRTFNPGDPGACELFELDLEHYGEQYQEIMDWAEEQPNIIDAVIAYIENHSEDGVLKPVTTDGRIRMVNMPKALDAAENGVDLK